MLSRLIAPFQYPVSFLAMQRFKKPVAFALVIALMGMPLLGSLSMGYALGKPGEKARKGKGKTVDHYQRNFLPPVANINPLLDATASTDENALETVSLTEVEAPKLTTSKRITQLDNTLNLHQSDRENEMLMKIQQQMNEQDLKDLWSATVEKNPVIRFSLEKLAMPEDVQEEHSSQFLKKSLNLLISGAAIAATMMPAGAGSAVGNTGNYYRNMGAMAGRDALSNVINGAPVQEERLSATEKIQLAGLIDELQGKLLQTYHNYRNTLQLLSVAATETNHQNELYAKALKYNLVTGQMASGAAYYKALLHENDLRQKAKEYRLKLERLAGTESVNQLALAVSVTDDILANADESKQDSTKASTALRENIATPKTLTSVVSPATTSVKQSKGQSQTPQKAKP